MPAFVFHDLEFNGHISEDKAEWGRLNNKGSNDRQTAAADALSQCMDVRV